MGYPKSMAKKQSRRSVSISKSTYERLKAYCETNELSMSQFVEGRIGDFLGRGGATAKPAPRPVVAKPTGKAAAKADESSEKAARKAADRIFTF